MTIKDLNNNINCLKIYVEKMFPPEAKEKARKMIDNLFLAYENRINNLPWMAKSTKDNAIAKLKKFNVKIRLDTPVEVEYYKNGGIL